MTKSEIRARYRAKPETKAKEAAYAAARYLRLKSDPVRFQASIEERARKNWLRLTVRWLNADGFDFGVLNSVLFLRLFVALAVRPKPKVEPHARKPRQSSLQSDLELLNRVISSVRHKLERSAPEVIAKRKDYWRVYQRNYYKQRAASDPDYRTRHRERVGRAAKKRIANGKHRESLRKLWSTNLGYRIFSNLRRRFLYALQDAVKSESIVDLAC